MATPVVSGAAALVLQKYPDMCNLELKYRLMEFLVKRAGIMTRDRDMGTYM